MSTLHIPRDLLTTLRQHAAEEYPHEGCGILLGRAGDAGQPAIVVRALPASNVREDEARHNRYLIEPRAILDAQRAARADGLAIIGYYHSHPDHPAWPSDFDRDHAWPDTSYLIVSVQGGTATDHRCFRLRDDRSAFDEQPVIGT